MMRWLFEGTRMGLDMYMYACMYIDGKNRFLPPSRGGLVAAPATPTVGEILLKRPTTLPGSQ